MKTISIKIILMQEILMRKLHEYIRENNPDVLLQLEADTTVTKYLTNKVSAADSLLHQLENGQPGYIIQDACMELLTQDLKPSRYNYICNILEEEFESSYLQFKAAGIMQFEAINLIKYCKAVFDDLNFNEENEGNRFLRYVIIGSISEYLESNSEKEKCE